tara:strand:+ start:413 stop:541 length:129 start_codon:yes stop_codon:yes gene_type:complete
MMAFFYYSFVETGHVTLGMAMGIPLLLTGVGLYVDAALGDKA